MMINLHKIFTRCS